MAFYSSVFNSNSENELIDEAFSSMLFCDLDFVRARARVCVCVCLCASAIKLWCLKEKVVVVLMLIEVATRQ